MKTLVLILLLSAPALANNCYIFDRGTESRENCLEQAAESEKRMNKIEQRQRDTFEQTNQAIQNQVLVEQLNLAIEASRNQGK